MVSTLAWEWKLEPVSPPTLYEDTVLFDDSSAASDLTAFELQSSIVKEENEIPDLGSSESKAEVFTKLLEEIEDFDQFEEIIKEESFSNWFEGKSEIPIFEDISIEPARTYSVQRFKTEELKPISQPYVVNAHQQNAPNTRTLLQEFETVFDAVEISHNTLTPPQSPPCTESQVITTLTPMPAGFSQPIVQPVFYQQIPERIPVQLSVELQPGTPQPDVAHELAVVEELVRSRAENLVDAWEDIKCNQDNVSPSSPSSSSSSSFSEYSSDPEWIPEPVQSSDYVDRPSKSKKRAGKPYSRVGSEDKKSRKKEQNKNAATRYRQKKKAEIEEILNEEKDLLDKHDDLDNKVTDLQREIKYLKGLMRDLFKAKGLIR